MKFVFVLAFFCAACVFAQVTAWPQTQTSWMAGMPRHEVSIMNATPWFSYVSVGGNTKKAAVVNLSPGETAATGAVTKGKKRHPNWKSAVPFTRGSVVQYNRSSDVDVPVIALFYADAEHRHYVGAGTSVFQVMGSGASSTTSIVFEPKNVRIASGVDVNNITTTPSRGFATKPLDLNMTIAEGISVQMLVWNSATPVHIAVNGVNQGFLHQGEVYCLTGRTPTSATLAQEENGRIRTWNWSFANQNWSGVRAKVFVLGSHDLH